jgi:site-specific DNA-methyltransferase (adenine-specific)
MKKMESSSIDLVFTDPPYGIEGDLLDQHYARDESYVVPGYVEVALKDYEKFSDEWISECARLLKPGGSIYVVSGYTNLVHVLNALRKTDLVEVNHLIARYSFGVSTKTKWVSSHYHVLYWCKPLIKNKTFNTLCRYSDIGDSYTDRQSVQEFKRDYKKQTTKNKNQLAHEFIEKFILYSSNRGDIILDPFLGGFTTPQVALKYGRKCVGFEMNKNAFDAFEPTLKDVIEIDDPTPIHPTIAEMEKKIKKRDGYKRQKEKNKIRQADKLGFKPGYFDDLGVEYYEEKNTDEKN